jgi:hypothetical protein
LGRKYGDGVAAPEYVPVKPMDDVRAYESPPRRPGQWRAERPGDLDAGQPTGAKLGWQGPDQGYALVLANRFRDQIQLAESEHIDDVLAGAVGIALKRASLLGRAPVIHDLKVALTLWGFFDSDPPADLIAQRRDLFEEVALPAHYAQGRRLVDAMPDDLLLLPPVDAEKAYRDRWHAQAEPVA